MCLEWSSWRAPRGLIYLSKISQTENSKRQDHNETLPHSARCLTLKMCAFRMWWPSSIVCWRFSLPSCRENMNARRACPFLGQKTQRLITRDPVPQHHRPSGENIATQPLNYSPGTSASPHKMAEIWPLYKNHFQAFLWIPLSLQSDPERSPRTGQVFIFRTNHCRSLIQHFLITLFIDGCQSPKCKFHETEGLV